MACYTAHQVENPHGKAGKVIQPRLTKTCEHCGKDFKTLVSRDSRFCSLPCRRKGLRETLTCPQCGTEFNVRPSSKRKYCSLACFHAQIRKPPMPKPPRKPVTYRPCARCGTLFRIHRPGHAHCSEQCRRPPVEIECPTCGKRVRIVPSNRSRFCSVRCYRRHRGETIPERNVRLSLEALGIRFEQEAVVPGWLGPVDFILTESNIALEVDEPYWHSKTADRDAKKTLFLQSRGFAVIRLVATPFYGDFAGPMVEAVREAIAEHEVTVLDVTRFYPTQLALAFD